MTFLSERKTLFAHNNIKCHFYVEITYLENAQRSHEIEPNGMTFAELAESNSEQSQGFLRCKIVNAYQSYQHDTYNEDAILRAFEMRSNLGDRCKNLAKCDLIKVI